MKRFVLIGLRLMLSAVFVYAGVLKLRDADATLVAVFQYKLLSWEASGVFATALPFLEITAGLALWIPRLRLGACALCTGLNLMFIAALASAVVRNLDVSCGCFGTTDVYTSALERLREDAALLFIGLWMFKQAAAEARARLQSLG